MRFHLITAKNADTEQSIFVGSQADAASKRKELVAEGFKRAEITTVEVDVPTDKAGLLDFLNLMAISPTVAAASKRLKG
jgi:hypothetical protein